MTTTSTSDIIVRQAAFADLDRVAVAFDRYRQFYAQPCDVEGARVFLKSRFENGDSVIFLAERGPDLLGFTQLYPSHSSISMARVFILNDLFVSESARRQGVAARLLAAATGYARAMNAVRVSLNTDVQNVNAQALYEAEGWKRDSKYYAYHFEFDR